MSRRLTFALLCLAGLLAAGDGAGRHYKNDRWGYKLRAPSGWIHAALSADEEWIASKHLGKRELRSKKGIFVSDERPEMWVIGFPHARRQDNETRVTKKKKSDVTSVFEFSFKNPYKDYKDFIRRERWFVGGGYYFSEEKEGEVAGMKVTMYEIKVEKMVAAPFRMVTWVFHADDVDFAVQFKILEDYYRSYKGTIRTCLKSFRRIPRKRALPGTSVTTGKKTITVEKPDDELTPEELKKRRLDKVEQAFRREIDALPKGWYHKRSEHFLVLSNGSKKYVRNVIAHAEAIRTYLDETFGSLGVDYVPPAIIRIFKTSVESRAYSRGTRRFRGNTSQVLLTEEWNTPQSTTWQITDQWLNFKNDDLTWNMPDWISSGLREHMGFARSKGKKVKFVFDSWDKDSLKKLLKNDEAVPLKKLILGVEDDKANPFSGGKFDFKEFEKMSRRSTQAGSVVTYLLTKGNRGKLKGTLGAYLGGLIVALEEAQAEYDKTVDKLTKEAKEEESKKAADTAKDDDEDDDDDDEEMSEAAKKRSEQRREALKKKRADIRKKAFDAGFGHLTDKDWKRIDTRWRRFVD